MESQHSLEIEWSNHEIIPKEDEVFFSFDQHQLPSLDFSTTTYDHHHLMNIQQDHLHHHHLDATYFMDMMSNTYPIFPSINIPPDHSSTLFEDGFLIGRYDDQIAFSNDQETYKMNSLVLPSDQETYTMKSLGCSNDQETYTLNSLGFSNDQETYTLNSLGFSNDQETYLMNSTGFFDQTHQETTAIKTVNDKEVQKEVDYTGVNRNNEGFGYNFQSRMMLTREVISQYFYMPITQAAKELNVGLTLLKKRCRELGIRRWPHRKLMSLQTLISNVQELKKSSGNGAEEVIELLEKEKKKMEEKPDLQLKDDTKRLRQSCFKANYKKRKTLINVNVQSSSSCSSTGVDHGTFEAYNMEDGFGDDEDQETIKSILFTDCFPSSSNVLSEIPSFEILIVADLHHCHEKEHRLLDVLPTWSAMVQFLLDSRWYNSEKRSLTGDNPNHNVEQPFPIILLPPERLQLLHQMSD
ncbi:hypothetical protein QVD17_38923 [Tagetes erecta]|uniref:RWP-RK domain-containing protein n=1 Tax=Tagetes erecta TaxID=13708 RepID=A0AAD8JPR5_TARER|nr:hypothetical protein QVD17_38923 [Tagetes erecta]